jgi:uncharacterized Ntn-hydrolase superfamily protein
MDTSITRAFISVTTVALAALLAASAAAAEPADTENIATFSVAAYDPSTGEVGVAVQSKFFAVGSVVPFCRAGIGAVATQARGNPTFGPRGLRLMRAGLTPLEALAVMLRDDEERASRQIGIVSVKDGGLAETYTGDECLSWAGGLTGVSSEGIVYAVQGNILVDGTVVEAMAAAMEGLALAEEPPLTDEQLIAIVHDDLAARMLAALIAGQQMGGDSRGMQSAALKVCQAGAGYGGYTDVKYDLRVDDAEDPFNELARLLNLARPFALITEGYNHAYAGEFDRAFDVFEYLLELDPQNKTHHYHYACALSLSGDSDAALQHLAVALEFAPEMIPHAREDPDLVALHGNKEFQRLISE